MIDMNVPNTLPDWAKGISVGKIRTDPFLNYYTVGEIIGRGKFAVVKKVTNKLTNEIFAAKFIRRRRKGEDLRDEILQEIAVLYLVLPHKRMIDVKEVFESRLEIIAVMEYAEGGELFQYCTGIDEEFAEKDVANLVRQILEGIIFLHDRNVVHLDIKPQNILLTKSYPEGRVKLCDFTCSQVVNEGDELRLIFGTPDYVAPEVLQYEPITTATDMWSVGVVVYALLTGASPFAGDSKQETYLNVSEVNLDFPEDLFCKVSDSAIDFMKKCLLHDPSSRLTARESLEHEWMTMCCPDAESPPPSPYSPSKLTPATQLCEAETLSVSLPHLSPSSPTPQQLQMSVTHPQLSASQPQLSSPIGSPLPCRRAVQNGCELTGEITPNKKYKCLEDTSNNNGIANGIQPISQEELVC